MSDSDRLRTQQKINIIQTERLTDALINGSQASAIADAQIRKNKQLANDIEDYEYALINLRKQRDAYKVEYEKLKEKLADWIVGQKAFKEVAIKYGKKIGISREQVIEDFEKAEISVLKNECEDEKSNISTSPLASEYREKFLKNKNV
jgi:hypothetical protein